MPRPRPAPRRCRGARRSRAGSGWSAPSAAISPRSRCSSASRRIPPGRLDGLRGVRVGLLPGRQQRDEERGVVAARLDLRGDPAGPRPQQVGAQRQPGARPAAGPSVRRRATQIGAGRAQPARSGAAPAGRSGAASSTPHSSNVSRTAACTSAPASSVGHRRRAPHQVGSGPLQRSGSGHVGGVDPTAGKHRHPAGERHPGHPPLQEHLQRVRARAAGPGGRAPAARSPPAAAGQAPTAPADPNPTTVRRPAAAAGPRRTAEPDRRVSHARRGLRRRSRAVEGQLRAGVRARGGIPAAPGRMGRGSAAGRADRRWAVGAPGARAGARGAPAGPADRRLDPPPGGGRRAGRPLRRPGLRRPGRAVRRGRRGGARRAAAGAG